MSTDRRRSGISHHREDVTPPVSLYKRAGRVQYRHRAEVEAAHPLGRALWSALLDDEAPCFADPPPWTDPATQADVDLATDACRDCPAMAPCLD